MNSFIKQAVFSLLLSASAGAALAQETRTGDDGSTFYVKSCAKGNGNVEVCTLCLDKSLDSRCALYLCDTRSKKVTPLGTTPAQTKALLEGKPLNTIGLSKQKAGALDYFSSKNDGVITYVLPLKEGFSLFSTGAGGSSSLPPGAIARERSAAELIALGQCLSKVENKYDGCLRTAGDDEGKQYACEDTFNKESAACGGHSVRILSMQNAAITAGGSHTIKR